MRSLRGSPEIEYQDFVVQVEPGRGTEWVARVLDSPAGQGEDLLRFPWQPGEQPGELPRLRPRAGEAMRDVAPAGGSAGERPPREVGEALYRALFSGRVGALWGRSLGLVAGRGLRLQLRLRLDPGAPDSAFLHSLPWELLYAPDTRDYLALSRSTPVVRYLEVPRPLPRAGLPRELRVLAVVSRPAGLSSLDLAQERRAIEKAWGALPAAEVVFLDQPRLGAIREALLGSPFQVLHFMGHGRLDRPSGRGQLFFEASGGGPAPVTGEELATQLKDLPELRLVFLNACETAAVAGGGLDPFAGVATALVMAGIPAVIAMQMPVSDGAAVAFCRAVHRRLAAGDPLDAAVTEGRQAIHAARPGTAEWAIPVLFTRVADGRIFAPAASQTGASGKAGAVVPERRQRRGWVAGIAACLFVIAILACLDALPLPVSPPPMKKVRVGPIQVGVYEVTRGEFRRFVLANPEWRKDRVGTGLQDGEYLKTWPSWHEVPPGTAGHPVTYVSWPAATAFCRWVHGRLPTVGEWQRVAHAPRGSFPWGPLTRAPADPPPLNFCDLDCAQDDRDPELRDGFPETAPVGSFPAGATPEGVLDLSGNVWEWTADASGEERATLGGSYLATFQECSTDRPAWTEARMAAPDGGFRCVWD